MIDNTSPHWTPFDEPPRAPPTTNNPFYQLNQAEESQRLLAKQPVSNLNYPLAPQQQYNQQFHAPAMYYWTNLNQRRNRDPQVLQQQPKKEEEQLPSWIKTHCIHQIKNGDTLIGLGFDYGVAPKKIKKANNLQTDEIYFKKTIIIPNPRSKPINTIDPADKEAQEKEDRRTKITAFKNKTGETDKDLVLEYLNRAHFDYKSAIKIYQDEKYEVEKRKRVIQKMTKALNKADRCPQSAKYYLMQTNWDLEAAKALYKAEIYQFNKVYK